MVYGFQVEPSDIELGAREIWKLSEDNPRAVSFAKQWLDINDVAGEILKPVIIALKQSCDNLQKNYTNLGHILDSSATELTNTANMYHRTDTKTAENLDRSYDPPEQPK